MDPLGTYERPRDLRMKRCPTAWLSLPAYVLRQADISLLRRSFSLARTALIGHYASGLPVLQEFFGFHVPASLCSTGVTPLLRSYGGSVTFRARLFESLTAIMNSVAVPGS
jgi:hypothetical protein